MKKKIIAAVLGVVFFCTSLGAATPAQAAKPGVYTANVVTSYYNPDTGKIDDQGGEANAALGEGMCRSAVATTGLVEVDKNGRTWVTLRMLLQSNCKNVAIHKRVGGNSYARANCTITAENSGADSIDYRFPVANAGQKLKGTMYVTPMGRDVVWYMWVNPNTMKAGSGNFVVNIDTSTPAPQPKPQPKPNAQNNDQAVDQDKDGDKDKDQDKDKEKESEEEKDKDKDEESEEELTEEEQEQAEEETDDADKDAEEEDAAEEDGEESDGMPVGAMVGVAVGVVALAGIIYYIRKKK